jgi:hypothetical protein
MDSQAETESASEEPVTDEAAAEEAVLEEDAPRRFRSSWLQRWGTVFLVGLFSLVTGLEYASRGIGGWEAAADSTMIGFLILACVANFQRSVLVGKKEIRKAEPLWKDQSVQIGDVRRVHVPATGKGVWLYIDPEGDVALDIGAGLENPNELRDLVLRRVPSSAEVTGLGQEEMYLEKSAS